MKHKKIIVTAVVSAVVLTVAFFWGDIHRTDKSIITDAGNISPAGEHTIQPAQPTDEAAFTPDPTPDPSAQPEIPDTISPSGTELPGISPNAQNTESGNNPENTPVNTTQPQIPISDTPEIDTKIIPKIDQSADRNHVSPSPAPDNRDDIENPTDGKLHCTLSISCTEILNEPGFSSKAKVVPPDGIIYSSQNVSFGEGETVFDVLSREMKNNRIHLEFSKTPAYNSYYIEGINNIYEFDFGDLSGWKYSVNGIFPGYSSSQYVLSDGDRISWVYTLDLTGNPDAV
ncbi:MAG: DUF4430 domain-containing protein [Oscillospiraceae bacterium]|nr:DUF4430 domain-containing protein [Oscillospiraceae bacterium]